MANNYVQTSIEIPAVTPEEIEWFEKFSEDLEDQNLTDDEMDKWMEVRGNPEVWPDYDYQVEGDTIFITSEECGNLDNICTVIQEFLAKFRPNDAIGAEWAFTCSSMRPGEFGGGAAFITAKSIRYVNTSNWLGEERAKWKKRQTKRGKKKKK